MTIALMQHGEAVSKAEDPERPLSAEGRRNVERVAAKSSGLLEVSAIYHSGKLRAAQTAEIMARSLAVPSLAREGLSPNDPVLPVAQWLSEQEPSLVVGHLPFLDRLLCQLLGCPEREGLLAFRNAGLIQTNGTQLQWVLWPEMA